MNRLAKNKVAPLALVLGLLLSSCGEKAECEIPSRHVHKYIKNFGGNNAIERYIDDERLEYYGYNWTSDYIEMTREDEKIYKLFKDNGIFDGAENWDYLYKQMASNKDYLEFYYEYTVREYKTIEDEDGNETVVVEENTYDGWTRNPNYIHNTGRTRLCHHRYFGYCVVYKDDKFSLVQSPIVDDIRFVINNYPYFAENNTTIVHKYYNYYPSELPKLNPENFNDFCSPDLTNKELKRGKSKTISKQN